MPNPSPDTSRANALRYGRSDTLQEVVSNKPAFLVRWSNFFFLLIFILIGFISWFVRYPEWIETKGQVEEIPSRHQPITIKLTGLDVNTGELLMQKKVTVKVLASLQTDPFIIRAKINQLSLDKDKRSIIQLIPDPLNTEDNESQFTPGKFYNLEISTDEISLLERFYTRWFK